MIISPEALLHNLNKKQRFTEVGSSPQTIHTPHTGSAKPYRIGIVTALPLEAGALMNVFSDLGYLPGRHAASSAVSFRNISCKSIDDPNLTHEIVLCQASKMGNNSAAVAATAMIWQFPTIQNIIMVGIAGGIPLVSDQKTESSEDHVRKGDIVVSQSVIQYDMVKRNIDISENRDCTNSPSPMLTGVIQRLQQESYNDKYPWEKYISALSRKKNGRWKKPRVDTLFDFEMDGDGRIIELKRVSHPRQSNRRRGKPLVHYAKIGSANILLKDHLLRNSLRQQFGLRAVEMEGSGIADAAWNMGVGYIVVRGIADYCDANKDNNWQHYAAGAAACYTRAVIERVPV